jgi:D-alanyl-D-alanine dipeptidase
MNAFREFSFKNNSEDLRDPQEFGFLVEPWYFNQGLANSPTVLVREGVLKKLLVAKTKLPDGLNFKIWDGYRTIKTQTVLYMVLYKKIVQHRPLLAGAKALKKTEEFVIRPSFDLQKPSPHNTGAAIDLTLVYPNGEEVDMGTAFDFFDKSSFTMHFRDAKEGTEEYEWHRNRMLLQSSLLEEGFYNFPDEWWHFSYGDRLWAEHYGKKALYGSWELMRG